MTNLKQKLVAAAMLCFVSTGAFAQKNDRRQNDRRPPKPPDKVVSEPKQPKEKPPQNSNQGAKKNEGKKGKP